MSVSTMSPSTPMTVSLDFRTWSLRDMWQAIEAARASNTATSVATIVERARSHSLDLSSEDALLTSAANLRDISKTDISDFITLVSELHPSWTCTSLRFDLPPNAIMSLNEELMSRTNRVFDAVASIPSGAHTTANTLLPLIDYERVSGALETMVTFPSDVSADKAVRDASNEAKKLLSAHGVQASMRVDVYESVLVYSKTADAAALQGEQKRFLEHMLRDYRRAGLQLPEEQRKRVEWLQTRISELSIMFCQNLGEENSTLEFARAELEGLPADKLNSLPTTADGKCVLTLKYPDVIPTFDFAKVEETRRRMAVAFDSRCMKENTAIAEELVALRDEKAKLLGYKTHADFVLEVRMAKRPEAVLSFLTDLSAKLDPLARDEYAYLLMLKEEEKKARGEPFDGVVNAWDFYYYVKRCEERKFEIDENEIKQYFPEPVVTAGLLEIYQTLLGLTFTRLPHDEAKRGGALWHEDVQLYRVVDTATSEPMGFFYFDLYPRQGKYGHAAVFPMQRSGLIGTSPSAARTLPIAGMLANFPTPSGGKPALFTHDNVVTYFHEFGHVMHHICSRSELHRFGGTSVERDAVEAPSQMLENWCYEKPSLVKMSGHVDNTSHPLPDELIRKLKAAKVANAGLRNKYQLLCGLFDQTIHTQAKVDTEETFNRLTREVLPVPPVLGTNPAAQFLHLACGYDASYYGYQWSEVYSMDMFASRFEVEGVMNPVTGRAYRDEILRPGASRNFTDSLVAFLGREPKSDAFLRSKGLASATSSSESRPFSTRSFSTRSSSSTARLMTRSRIDTGSILTPSFATNTSAGVGTGSLHCRQAHAINAREAPRMRWVTSRSSLGLARVLLPLSTAWTAADATAAAAAAVVHARFHRCMHV